jgi:hypothetical protein
MARRTKAPEGEGITLTQEQVNDLERIMLESIERNPAGAGPILRMARAAGITSVIREYNRLNKFAARKSG